MDYDTLDWDWEFIFLFIIYDTMFLICTAISEVAIQKVQILMDLGFGALLKSLARDR